MGKRLVPGSGPKLPVPVWDPRGLRTLRLFWPGARQLRSRLGTIAKCFPVLAHGDHVSKVDCTAVIGESIMVPPSCQLTF